MWEEIGGEWEARAKSEKRKTVSCSFLDFQEKSVRVSASGGARWDPGGQQG